MTEFFMAMEDVPTVTAQEHKVTVRNGKPIFYDPPEIKNAKQEYEKPFPYEELLKENITRQMEIDAELEIKDQEECVEVQEETQNLPCQKAIR